jgi:hypothetical protein
MSVHLIKRSLQLLSLALTVSCLLLFFGETAQAQDFNFANSHIPLMSVDGQWRFHVGDNPAWSRPNVDDSKWELLRSDESWASQGHPGYSGVAWYRFQVDVPSDMKDVSLYLPYILTSYEVYVDGRLVGTYGKLPPRPAPYWGGGWFRTYRLLSGNDAGRTLHVAIRVWHWPGWVADFGGGPTGGGALIGDPQSLSTRDSLQNRAHHWDLSGTMILAILQTLAGIGSLMLFQRLRSGREYLWFGIMMLVGAAAGWLTLSYVFNTWNVRETSPLQDAFSVVFIGLAEAGFYLYLLKGKRTLLLKIAVGCLLLVFLYCMVQAIALLVPRVQPWFGTNTVSWLEALLQLPLQIWILLLLFTRARENSLDARMLIAPVTLQVVAQLFQNGAIVTSNLGLQNKLGYNIVLLYRPFQIELLQVVDVLFLLVMLGILVYRFTQTTVEWQRAESDLESARLVQRSLLPQQMPYIRGYSVEMRSVACYAVGGDYLDIVPMPSGEIMIVLADVAGKGLSSAMVGCSFRSALRAMVSSGIPLVEIATRMNTLHFNEGQPSRNRYVTAILLQFDPGSNRIQVVNAGHNPPFLISGAGPERIQKILASGVPIGMLADSTYSQESYSLPPGAKLLLYTDGLTEVFRGDEEFGEARLLQSFLDSELLDAEGILDSLWSVLHNFTDQRDQTDDMSAIVLLREA